MIENNDNLHLDPPTKTGIGKDKYLRPEPLLIAISGPALGQIYPIKLQKTIIGRKGDVDILIQDESISRKHAKITYIYEGPVFVVVDLGSKNGVLINGKEIKEAKLEDGDRITLGETTLKFIYQDAVDINYYRRIAELIHTDPLTGLRNRYLLEDSIKNEIDRCQRYEETFCILMIDIDHFKKVNDAYGHITGDKILIMLGELYKNQLRKSDYIFRYGGEEFLILLPQTSITRGSLVAERLCNSIRNILIEGIPPITVSIGVAAYPDNGLTPSVLIKEADEALFTAKNTGRNRVITAG